MNFSFVPNGPLASVVEKIWATALPENGAGPASASASALAREYVLPTGQIHIVFRLSGRPLRLFAGPDDGRGDRVGTAIVGGARLSPYLKAADPAGPSVGALLRHGAARAILGVPGAALAHAHTPLEDIWGRSEVDRIADRLLSAPDLETRAGLFAAILYRRAFAAAGRNPADRDAAQAAAELRAGRLVGDLVAARGVSHRHFSAQFTQAVGLTPKAVSRLYRFRNAAEAIFRDPSLALAEQAVAAGYADQSHLTREFAALAGMTPDRYRHAGPASAMHVLA